MRSPVSLVPLLVSLALALALGAGCGGAGNVGEACGTPGSADDCVEGAICATDESTSESGGVVWESYTCRAACAEQTDCAAGEECRGVTGAPMQSACQPARSL